MNANTDILLTAPTAEWWATLAKQEGRCAVCKTAFPQDSSLFQMPLDVHENFTFGLLCGKCANVVTVLRSANGNLEALVDYMLQAPAATTPAAAPAKTATRKTRSDKGTKRTPKQQAPGRTMKDRRPANHNADTLTEVTPLWVEAEVKKEETAPVVRTPKSPPTITPFAVPTLDGQRGSREYHREMMETVYAFIKSSKKGEVDANTIAMEFNKTLTQVNTYLKKLKTERRVKVARYTPHAQWTAA